MDLKLLFLFLNFNFAYCCYKYTGEKRNPCEDLRCGPGEECVVNQNNGVLVANCMCPQQCPNYGDSVESSPVCSSHGVDYQSSCHLRHHACESKSNITIKYYGRCDPCFEFKCPNGLICQLGVDRKPECRCSEQCPLHFEPVCGSDGKTYTNECILKLATCKEQREISVWKKGKCEEINSPCEALHCDHGSTCNIVKNGEASCNCPNKCEAVMRPVCATNGETYANECEMRKKSCEIKSNIDIKHQGTCGIGACATYNSCKKPQVCIAIDGKPKCSCPKCSDELKEVCGSDGQTYSNECKLHQTACLTNKEIFVKYNSVCEGCENKKCDFYSSCVVGLNAKAECKCPVNCPVEEQRMHNAEVCGTDGITYSSECHLRKSSCHQKKFIVVAFEGKCDACLNVQCRYGEECRGGQCICSYNCPASSSPSSRVCGENGVLYPSLCHLQSASCQKGAPISEMPLAHCHSSKITFPDPPHRPTSLCTMSLCSFGATCHDGQCFCPVCNLSSPYAICGSDGVVYRNQCHLNTISCRDQRDIHVLPLLSQCSDQDDKCECNRVGSFGHTCDEFGQCKCRPGVSGLKCDHCHQTFWGIHLIAEGALSCRPCGCSVFGSARLDCEQSTGKCECRGLAMGDKCDLCPVGMILTPSGCVLASEYKTPRDCHSQKCYHGAKCVPSPASFPDCVCPKTCNNDHFGIVSNMTVCGSDGTTYSNMCELQLFACKHQIDLVPISMGICDDDESFEKLDRLEREKNAEKRLGSSCTSHEECKKLNGHCISRPGRKSTCDCSEGWKSMDGICIELPRVEDENRMDFETFETDHFWIPDRKISRQSTINLQIRLHSRKPGTLLKMVTDDGKNLEIRHENRRLIVRIGKYRVESLQSVAYNISLEIKWKRNEIFMKINGEIQSRKFEDLLDSSVAMILLGTDGNWETNRVNLTIYQLIIDGTAVQRETIRKYYMPPVNSRTLKLSQGGFLKFENLGQDVREKSRFDVIFKTNSANGLLLYWSSPQDPKSDFVGLALIDSKIHFVFDLGSGLSYLKSKPIALNTWVKARIERTERNVSLFVNEKLEKMHNSQGSNHHLDIGKEDVLYFGHVPNDDISKKVQKLNRPFDGEIQQIRINELPLNLVEGLTNEQRGNVDIGGVGAMDRDCLESCDGACFDRMGKVVCRENDEENLRRSIHINEYDELIYPNNATFSVGAAQHSDISFEFRTMKEYGIVWFEGGWSEKEHADFLMIFIDEGKLYIAVNLGNDQVLKPISTNLTVADNRWHSVVFKRKERKCDLWVDAKRILTVITSPGDDVLNSNGLAYFGGPKKSKQLRTMKLQKKFVGCVRKLKIFGKHVNLLQDSINDVEEPKYCVN